MGKELTLWEICHGLDYYKLKAPKGFLSVTFQGAISVVQNESISLPQNKTMEREPGNFSKQE